MPDPNIISFAGLLFVASGTPSGVYMVGVVAPGEDYVRGSFRLSAAEWAELKLAVAETEELRRQVQELSVRVGELTRRG